MTNAMSAELYWLAWTTVFTGLLWLPYILQIIRKIGVNTALSETGGVEPHHSWSVRAKKAHANAVENLMIFAPLALAVHILEAGSAATALSSGAYFAFRVAHAFVYTLGVPYLRTLAFAGGVVCQGVLALAVLG